MKNSNRSFVSFPNLARHQVEFIRAECDLDKATKSVEASPPPKKYADMLRKAYLNYIIQSK